jgi:MFS family permease
MGEPRAPGEGVDLNATDAVLNPPIRGPKALQPLRDKTFRTIWTASLFAYFGQLVLGVAAAWEMTRLGSPQMVALVQTALMLPLMLIAVPAGAIADMFDRRKIAMTGLGFAIGAGTVLTLLSTFGLAGPWVLLAFCFLIGAGVALYSPAWQSSIPEQVPVAHLPAAVSLGSVSYNVARSFGPALGGMIVLAFGAKAAFGLNALFYLPLFVAFYFWKRRHVPPRLPPERLYRAVVSGLRYAIHASAVRTVMIRAVGLGLTGASVNALIPLIAKEMLHGGPGTYGTLLGALGVGAVIGAFAISDVRDRLPPDIGLGAGAVILGLMLLVVAFSRSLPITMAAMAIVGASNMVTASLLNVSVQLSVPRWVTARALAWYQSSLTGGGALGAWLWGRVTLDHGVTVAMAVSGLSCFLLPVLGLLLPMPRGAGDVGIVELTHEPEVALKLTARSGPVVLELDYRVDPAEARSFYAAIQRLQNVRRRNGAFDWSIARDIGDEWLWTERFTFPTWGDYLHQRTRYTHDDTEVQALVNGFNQLQGERRVRRRLERPTGSVRWRPDTPDPKTEAMRVYGP